MLTAMLGLVPTPQPSMILNGRSQFYSDTRHQLRRPAAIPNTATKSPTLPGTLPPPQDAGTEKCEVPGTILYQHDWVSISAGRRSIVSHGQPQDTGRLSLSPPVLHHVHLWPAHTPVESKSSNHLTAGGHYGTIYIYVCGRKLTQQVLAS